MHVHVAVGIILVKEVHFSDKLRSLAFSEGVFTHGPFQKKMCRLLFSAV